ncbi:MAG: hypothetical protein IKW31_01020 [Alistipes sp.]|nr:hypothetical protein [Alistipes sp.]
MKKILFFATVAALLVSCGAATTSKTPDYYFDEEVSRLYNDPNAEMDTLSYATGMNMGLVISLQNADFGVDTESVIALVDDELKSVVTDKEKFDEINEYMTKYSTELVRPYMMAKRINERVETDRPDTLSLPELYNETYTREGFTEALVVVFADNIRKQRLNVNLHWVYQAMRDAIAVKDKSEIDSLMAIPERRFMTVLADYMHQELPAYNLELSEKWFANIATKSNVEALNNAKGEATGAYYRINRAGGETKPTTDNDTIAIKYAVYSRTGTLLESNEMFVQQLTKQREALVENQMIGETMRQTYLDQIDAELANSDVRRMTLKTFMQKDVQEALKLIGNGGSITIWMDAQKALGFRARQLLPVNEAVVVDVELIEVKNMPIVPLPTSNVVRLPAKDAIKEGAAPAAGKVAPQTAKKISKPTIIPVEKQ